VHHSTCYVFTHRARVSTTTSGGCLKGHRFNSLRDFEVVSKCTFLKCNETEVRFAGRQKDTCGERALFTDSRISEAKSRMRGFTMLELVVVVAVIMVVTAVSMPSLCRPCAFTG